MLAQLAQMATALVNPHFLLAQNLAQNLAQAGTNPLFPAQIQNHRSLCPLTSDLCPLTADHEQRATNHEPNLSIRVTRSSVGFSW